MQVQPKYLTGFESTHADLWGRHTCHVEHSLHKSPLFADEALAELIERAPKDSLDIVYMGEQGSPKKYWRRGELGDASGEEAIEAVRAGRMWISLIGACAFAPEYQELVDEMFEEQESLVPGFKTFRRKAGILISSPKAQVYYHCDVPGQSLWQIRGVKRVYLYPNTEPFLDPADLEGVILGETEEEISYREWYDQHATVIDLQPGEMLNWALNGPHRVENHDMLNVSMTTEHYTNDIRRSYAMNLANGILRKRLGIQPRSRSIRGSEFWVKAGLVAAWRAAGLHRRSNPKPTPDFRIAPNAENKIEDIVAS